MHCYYVLVQVIRDGCTWCKANMENAAGWNMVKPLLKLVPIKTYRAQGNTVYVYIYMYIYTYIYGGIYIYIYTYIYI